MNIFVLDANPAESAKQHCDKHVVKMHTECVQMLVSVLQRYGIKHDVRTKAGTIHKGGYANHPCTRWTGDSFDNFFWVIEYAEALVAEHTHRYGTVPFTATQIRKVVEVADEVHNAMVFEDVADAGLTPFALAMPDEYKTDDAVESYRDYYIGAKSDIATWGKNRPAPEWYSEAFSYAGVS